MSQGRPNHPPKGTPQPGEPGRPEAGKGPEAAKNPQAAKSPEAGKAAGGPAGSQGGTADKAQAGAKPGGQPSPAAGQPSSKPAAASGGPPPGRPGDGKPGAAATGPRPASSAPGTSGGGTSGGGTGSGGAGAGASGPSGSGSGGRTPPPPPPPAAAPAARGGGWVPGVVGGVVGAVLAVIGAPLVQGPPPLGPEAQSRIASIESDAAATADRIAALQSLADDLDAAVLEAVEAAVAEVPSRDGAAIAALAEEVEGLAASTAALDTRLTETTDALAARLTETDDALNARLTETSETMAAQLATTAEELAAARDAAVSGLDERLTAAVERLDGLSGEIEQRLDAASSEVGELLRETREATGQEVAAVQVALTGELEALRGQVAAATTELAAVQDEVEAFKQARNRAAAAALLVRDIDRSIDAGTPFAEPLGYLLPMAEDDAALIATLAGLQPYAEAGVPTMQDLRDGLLALAETEAPAEIAGSEFLGQAVQNLYALVQVRSKEDEVGIALGLLGDADAALRAGDIATAIEHVEAAVATPNGIDVDRADDWLGDARARLTAVDAQTRLDAQIRELLTATVN